MIFKTILADCPWDHESWSVKGKSRSPERHYPVMSLDALCSLPVASVAAPNANLLLWTTSVHMEQAMAVIRAWGFAYVSVVPWIKMLRTAAPKRGLGYHSMSCAEYLLIGKRGKGTKVERGNLGIIFHPVGPHSAKPDDQYDWAEHYEGPYLEMFARPDGSLFPPRPNWTFLGNAMNGADIATELRLINLQNMTERKK